MDKNYFMDTLFDLINESDALDAELQDIQIRQTGLLVTLKDGAQFTVQIDLLQS